MATGKLWIIATLFLSITSLGGSYDYPFCHELKIKENFKPDDLSTMLILNASYKAIHSAFSGGFSGNERCSCTVTAMHDIGMLVITLVVSNPAVKCFKRIDVIGPEDTTLTSLGCDPVTSPEYSLLSGQAITLELSARENFTLLEPDSIPSLYVKTETEVALEVRCYPPKNPWATVSSETPTTFSMTPSTTLNSPTTELASSTATPQFHKGPNESVVIAGVIVGLGLTFLFLITCLLCFIARRRKRNYTNNAPPDVRTGFRYRLRRTMTVIRDKMINRPLPKIPGTSEEVSGRNSGFYYSIRSDTNPGYDGIISTKTKASKEDSCNSIESYLEPISKSSTVEKRDENENEQSADLYIHPSGSSCETVSEKVYINEMRAFQNGIESKYKDSVKTTNEPKTVKKSPLLPEDSHGYVPMKKSLRKLLLLSSVGKYSHKDERSKENKRIGESTTHIVQVGTNDVDDSMVNRTELFPDLIQYGCDSDDSLHKNANTIETGKESGDLQNRPKKYVKQNTNVLTQTTEIR